MIKVVEKRPRREVAAAVLMSVVVRRLFVDDQTPQFHVAFLGFFNRPVVYFSWSGNLLIYIMFSYLILVQG